MSTDRQSNPSTRASAIVDGTVLTGGALRPGQLSIAGDRLVDDVARDARVFDASGLLVLPGIVDLHGDAFERQLMPRPKVHFPMDVALMESDRQLVANGITTAYHGVTVSWEPGLRSEDTARRYIDAWQTLRPRLNCDTLLHLRWETFALVPSVRCIARWARSRPNFH